METANVPAQSAEEIERKWLSKLASYMGSQSFSTAQSAALRRMNPECPGPRIIEYHRMAEYSGLSADRMPEQRKRLLVHCLALIGGRHSHAASCGGMLFEIGLGEARLCQLLSADYETLADLLPRLCRRLGAGGKHVNFWPIVSLVRYTQCNEALADKSRERIAVEYVRAERATEMG